MAVAIHINWTNIDKTNYLIKQNQIKLENYEQTKDFSILAPLNLPLNTNYLLWGKVLSEMVKPNTYKIVDLYSYIKRNIKRYLEVSILKDIDREVNLFSVLNDNKIGSFFDKIINKTNNYFIRVVNNTTYHIKNSKLFFIFEQLFPKEFITRLKKKSKI